MGQRQLIHQRLYHALLHHQRLATAVTALMVVERMLKALLVDQLPRHRGSV
jgi:hypothetical protein